MPQVYGISGSNIARVLSRRPTLRCARHKPPSGPRRLYGAGPAFAWARAPAMPCAACLSSILPRWRRTWVRRCARQNRLQRTALEGKKPPSRAVLGAPPRIARPPCSASHPKSRVGPQPCRLQTHGPLGGTAPFEQGGRAGARRGGASPPTRPPASARDAPGPAAGAALWSGRLPCSALRPCGSLRPSALGAPGAR